MESVVCIEKPCKCSCGGKVARILYGTPRHSKELQADIDAGRIILGGCCVTDDAPTWQCVNCGKQFYKVKAGVTRDEADIKEQALRFIADAGACEIIMALHLLHKQGYEQLRLLPGMSPNGLCWRWHIYPKNYIQDIALERNGCGEAPEREHPMGSTSSARSNTNVENLVAAIKYIYPQVVQEGKAPDGDYIKWFKQIVDSVQSDNYPVAFSEYFDSTKGWQLGRTWIDYPPYE